MGAGEVVKESGEVLTEKETEAEVENGRKICPVTKGDRTRRAILAAAVERFGRDGFRATAVVDIARDAGVGGSLVYAYFPSKETLFFEAVDEDAAGVIEEGLGHLEERAEVPDWRPSLFFTLVDAVERHPLARRVLAGLEPGMVERVQHIPALEELRKAVAERLRSDQFVGRVRTDIDPNVTANGVIAIVLSLLMTLVQLGKGIAASYVDDVDAVIAAAIEQQPPAIVPGPPSDPGR